MKRDLLVSYVIVYFCWPCEPQKNEQYLYAVNLLDLMLML